MKLSQRLICFLLVAALVPVMASDGGAVTLRELPPLDYQSFIRSPSQGAAFFQSGTRESSSVKSSGKAVLYSLLLPGLGHSYLGQSGPAKLFYTSEAVIWGSFATLRIQGHLRENGYKDFAQTFGEVASTDHTDDFYRILTQYNSSLDYEADIKSEGRIELANLNNNEFPNAEELEQYFLENRISDFEPWSWVSANQRRAYQNRRAASRRANRRSLYAAATALANRVVSAFFALKAARDINNDVSVRQPKTYLEFGSPMRYTDPEYRTGVSIVRRF